MTTMQTDKPAAGEMSADDFAASPFMRWVKVAMVVMGVLIIAGFVFIAYEVWRRQTDPDYAAQVDRRRLTAPAEAQAPVARPVVPTAVAGTPFQLPAGARIVEQTPMGGRLAVRVDLADGAQVIYLVTQGSRAVEIQPVMTAPGR